MRIGLLYDLLRQDEKMLISAAERLGHRVELIHVPSRIDWIHDTVESDSMDFALERCVSHYRALASAIIFEGRGIRVVNSFRVIYESGDKLVTTIRLAKAGVPVPRTAIAYSRSTAIAAAREIGYPIVVKPILGSWGRMIARASTEEDLLDIMDFRENMPSPHFKIHYVQEYIEKPGRDIRAFYVWGEVPTAIYRISDRWKTNTALGGKALPAELGEEQVELVIKASEAIGGGVLGVDLMETREGEMYVSEVNAITEFRNTVRVTGYDLPSKIIQATVEEIKG